jgi:hypothetical protein
MVNLACTVHQKILTNVITQHVLTDMLSPQDDHLMVEIYCRCDCGFNQQTHTESRLWLRVYLCVKQERQCMYNVTLRRVHVTTVAVEKQYYIFRVCVCSLSYPACKPHVWLYYIFQYYLINGTIFGKKIVLDIKSVTLFSLQIWSQTFLILRRIQRDTTTNVYRSSRKVPVILVRF